ncbi:MAG: nucleoside hydrolase [Candidatus Poribacteria bacterium]|nr:nucleoside hydrolase [Candidatus Poribacteria bacterium]MDE0505923.1 nucleoside hydrolase [Candidatus Poribacteria bacterium]
MKRILIDTDIGVDDALAVIFALKSPELHVEAITTVSGNVHVEQCTRNLLITLGCMELKEIPLISQGEEAPLTLPLVTSAHVHGSDGLGGISESLSPDGTRLYPPLEWPLSSMRGPDAIIDLVNRYSGELILVPVGPLTNIAKAMLNNPTAMRGVREIVLMGGVFEIYGNVTTQAEFNIYADPQAAQVVFNFGVPVTMTPLDVTHDVVLTRDRLDAEANQRNTRLIQFLRDSTQACMVYHQGREGVKGLYLHDPLAIGYLLQPDLFDVVDAYVQVETPDNLTRGRTVGNLRAHRADSAPNARVCVGVDADRFLRFFLDRVVDGH